MSEQHPTHGWTRRGQPVHARTIDHARVDSRYQRLNKAVAVFITEKVMTMTFFWMANALALCSLPAILSEFNAFHSTFPNWLRSASLVALIAWVSSNWLQLIFLPALGVGQRLASVASDARAAKSFEDTELVVDRLDEHTAGGIKSVLDAIAALDAKIPEPKASKR